MGEGHTPADKIGECKGRFYKAPECPWKTVTLYPVPYQKRKQEGYEYLRHDDHAEDTDDGNECDGTQCRVLCKDQDTQAGNGGNGR